MRSPSAGGILVTAPILLIPLLALIPNHTSPGAPQSAGLEGQSVQSTPEPLAPTTEERMQMAFPGFKPGAAELEGLFPGRLVNRDFTGWPPMRYLGDSALIAGKTFTVQQALLVPGETYPIIYEPATGKRQAAFRGLRTNLFDFSKNKGVFIPANSSLLMIRVDVEPEAVEPPPGMAGCSTRGERDYGHNIRISYPMIGESQVLLTDRDEAFAEFGSPRLYCLTRGWLYFHVRVVEPELNSIWIEIVDDETGPDLAIWSLVHLSSE